MEEEANLEESSIGFDSGKGCCLQAAHFFSRNPSLLFKLQIGPEQTAVHDKHLLERGSADHHRGGFQPETP